jgi:hypothetical protein
VLLLAIAEHIVDRSHRAKIQQDVFRILAISQGPQTTLADEPPVH